MVRGRVTGVAGGERKRSMLIRSSRILASKAPIFLYYSLVDLEAFKYRVIDEVQRRRAEQLDKEIMELLK
jgi:hypothetical protein